MLETVRDGDAKRDIKARPYMSNLLHARLKTFFDWCSQPQIGKLPMSPMLSVGKPYGGETRRERAWFSGEHAD